LAGLSYRDTNPKGWMLQFLKGSYLFVVVVSSKWKKREEKKNKVRKRAEK
jgi:hypothetical protein